jgi:hypothetical protein
VQKLFQLSLAKIPVTALDKQKAKDAIAGLEKITRNLPSVDAVAIAGESWENLEERYVTSKNIYK